MENNLFEMEGEQEVGFASTFFTVFTKHILPLNALSNL